MLLDSRDRAFDSFSRLRSEHRSRRSYASHARFAVDVADERKRRRTTKGEREKKGALRGRLPRRISLGVCPPGRGERAVTERDGVTKGGTRMRWNGTYTFSSLPHRCFAEEGAYRHGAHGNAQAPSAEDPRPFDEYTRSLSPSLCHSSLTLPLSRALTFPRSLSPSSPAYHPFALCLSTRLSVFVFIISHPTP